MREKEKENQSKSSNSQKGRKKNKKKNMEGKNLSQVVKRLVFKLKDPGKY